MRYRGALVLLLALCVVAAACTDDPPAAQNVEATATSTAGTEPPSGDGRSVAVTWEPVQLELFVPVKNEDTGPAVEDIRRDRKSVV